MIGECGKVEVEVEGCDDLCLTQLVESSECGYSFPLKNVFIFVGATLKIVAETLKIVDKVEIISEVVDHKVKTIVMITIIHNRKDEILIEIAVAMVEVMVVAVLVAVTMVIEFL